MMTLTQVLVVIACVLFTVAAAGVASRFNLIAAGLAIYMLSLLVG